MTAIIRINTQDCIGMLSSDYRLEPSGGIEIGKVERLKSCASKAGRVLRAGAPDFGRE